MIIVVAVVAVLLVGAAAAWAVSRIDVPGVPPAVTTEAARPLPAGPLHPEALDDLRLDVVVRGYRMEQVDAALARLGQELVERDAEIARLREAAEHTGGQPR